MTPGMTEIDSKIPVVYVNGGFGIVYRHQWKGADQHPAWTLSVR